MNYPIGKRIVETIFQWTGIPVSLGIGSTKTLAKAANYIAKNQAGQGGVFNLGSVCQNDFLSQIDISEIWGIGQRWSAELKKLNIFNAKQLSEQDPVYIQKRFNITLAATVLELKGTTIQALELKSKPRKEIIVSRSFGKTVTQYSELRESVSLYTTRALEKLRRQNSTAQSIQVFLQTNRFSHPTTYHSQTLIELSIPSQNTIDFLKAALSGLEKLYKPNLQYKKAGVVLRQITDKSLKQYDIFTSPDLKSPKLMALLDNINEKMGRGTLQFGAEGFQKAWTMRALSRSPHYTTQWSELLRV